MFSGDWACVFASGSLLSAGTQKYNKGLKLGSLAPTARDFGDVQQGVGTSLPKRVKMAIMERTKINIGVVSDIVCPWCYIGKRRLERAMERVSDRFVFEVEYFPFELNPRMPAEGIDFNEYLCKKFGSESKSRELSEHVRRVAGNEGLHFNLDMQQRRPNTRDAHRIIMFARDEGRQLDVVERFFRAFFTEGIDLSVAGNLIAIAGGAGLDTDTIEALLHTNTGKLEIEMAEKELTDLGITSVPLYIIDNRMAISGAQSIEAFTKAFEEAALVMAH